MEIERPRRYLLRKTLRALFLYLLINDVVNICMQTLHTFGCSVTQGFSLPDVVKPLSDQEIAALGRELEWTDAHIPTPSAYAWPSMLAALLGTTVQNHAVRGACWQQIARQCAVAASSIQPGDTVVVMWTFFSRFSPRIAIHIGIANTTF